MAPRHKRKLSDTIATTLATIQLKPLQGARIEAVTRTHNERRAAGVNSEVELPATVVAGDTSSGKSSVMSRLTGLPFPRGEGVVTKLATEVDMMPGPKETIQVSIRPDKSRPEDEQAALLRYIRDIELDDFEATFTDVCMFMGRPGDRKLFADVLHISFTRPSCPPLTVIDLPGLIHAATQKVSDADRKLSEKLAKQYIRDKRTITSFALGTTIPDPGPQRKSSMKICNYFHENAQAEINGVRSNIFGGQADDASSTSDEDTLRSTIESLHTDFANAMRALEQLEVLLADSKNAYAGWSMRTIQTDFKGAVNWAIQVQKSSKNWADFAREHIDRIASKCKAAIREMMMDRNSMYAECVASQIQATWINPHLDAKLDEVKAILAELEEDTFTTLSAYTPRLDQLKDAWHFDFATADQTGTKDPGSRMSAIANLEHAIAYYDIDLEYWVTAVFKQVAERFMPQIKKVMTESKELSSERKVKQDTVDRLQFALDKLDAQLKALGED